MEEAPPGAGPSGPSERKGADGPEASGDAVGRTQWVLRELAARFRTEGRPTVRAVVPPLGPEVTILADLDQPAVIRGHRVVPGSPVQGSDYVYVGWPIRARWVERSAEDGDLTVDLVVEPLGTRSAE